MTMTAPVGKDQPCTSNVPLPDMEGKPSKISIKVANQWYTRATITASKIRSFTQNSKHAECGGDERVKVHCMDLSNLVSCMLQYRKPASARSSLLPLSQLCTITSIHLTPGVLLKL